MATLTDTEHSLLPKIQAPPEWGIEPVPQTHRILGLLDYTVLWGDLAGDARLEAAIAGAHARALAWLG